MRSVFLSSSLFGLTSDTRVIECILFSHSSSPDTPPLLSRRRSLSLPLSLSTPIYELGARGNEEEKQSQLRISPHIPSLFRLRILSPYFPSFPPFPQMLAASPRWRRSNKCRSGPSARWRSTAGASTPRSQPGTYTKRFPKKVFFVMLFCNFFLGLASSSSACPPCAPCPPPSSSSSSSSAWWGRRPSRRSSGT